MNHAVELTVINPFKTLNARECDDGQTDECHNNHAYNHDEQHVYFTICCGDEHYYNNIIMIA